MCCLKRKNDTSGVCVWKRTRTQSCAGQVIWLVAPSMCSRGTLVRGSPAATYYITLKALELDAYDSRWQDRGGPNAARPKPTAHQSLQRPRTFDEFFISRLPCSGLRAANAMEAASLDHNLHCGLKHILGSCSRSCFHPTSMVLFFTSTGMVAPKSRCNRSTDSLAPRCKPWTRR